MTKVKFVTMTDARGADRVLSMMRALYEEDPPESAPNHERFPPTIDALLADPSRGRFVQFINGASTVGYAILIPYWSNEFGGTVLFIDELFVTPELRSQGVGH